MLCSHNKKTGFTCHKFNFYRLHTVQLKTYKQKVYICIPIYVVAEHSALTNMSSGLRTVSRDSVLRRMGRIWELKLEENFSNHKISIIIQKMASFETLLSSVLERCSGQNTDIVVLKICNNLSTLSL